MPFKIIRNDITKMNTDAIVNTASRFVGVGEGCDTAVYAAAGHDTLLRYRKEQIGEVAEGNVFITPGFNLPAKHIIHAVSPLYINGECGEEDKLRSCYRKSLELAVESGIQSIAFPLISTGGFGYPKEEGMRIAVDEINAFLLRHQMMIYLVVFDPMATRLGANLYPDLESYIDRKYVDAKHKEEYGFTPSHYDDAIESAPVRYDDMIESAPAHYDDMIESASVHYDCMVGATPSLASPKPTNTSSKRVNVSPKQARTSKRDASDRKAFSVFGQMRETAAKLGRQSDSKLETTEEADLFDLNETELSKRMEHLADSFSEYLLYLIESKGMTNAEVYKRAIVDKKVFSKIKNNADYHPQKITAMCLCVGAKLNLDETKDLLARAGYALSPCDKTDIIFSYFIENEIYDMIELDIQLEEHGLNCLIS